MARNLLRDDGTIFISIDDQEIDNLRKICNEVFGEDTFVGLIVVQSNKRGQTYKQISKTHEYVLVYSREPDVELCELEKAGDALPFKDSKGPFDLWELRNRNPKFGRFNRQNLFFSIYVAPGVTDENGYAKVSLTKDSTFSIEVVPLNSREDEGCWRWGTDKVAADLSSASPALVAKKTRDGKWNVYEKSRKSTTKAKSLWTDTSVISEQGTRELGTLGLADVFEHPKPLGLIERCVKIGCANEDIVLDFFAGSGTTGHAVLELNAKDRAKRKFILVQLPEPVEARGFKNIADVTKERVRRAIASLDKGSPLPIGIGTGERGFRVLKLAESSFTPWDSTGRTSGL